MHCSDRLQFKTNISPAYMSDIYTLNSSPVVKTRRSVDSFVEPICVKEMSRKSISYLGSKIWHDLDKNIKTSTSTNSFKHVLKTIPKKLNFCLFMYLFYIYIYIYICIYIYIHIYGYIYIWIYHYLVKRLS